MQDITLDIAIGSSRKEINWKNTSVLWSVLKEKLSKTHYTAETIAQYNKAAKPRQDEIKDIGGFVGGFLAGGKRKSGRVLHRQLITLDLDTAKPGVWDTFTLLFDCSALVYSTHKHTPEKPRLRLVIPLDREVNTEEYEAIGRSIAGSVGIDMFDPTSFQPERLMYWPSTSKDGVFEFQFQDGPIMSADEILGSYRDWTDISSWPIHSNLTTAVLKSAKTQGDPLEKPGYVGAFCRVYSIQEVIEKYLSEYYTPCDSGTDEEGRYTYISGSTSGGLVIYEDKFAYSHHGTDPVSGKLCNAFDLCRIHLFADKDKGAKEGTPINKMPSFIAMGDLAVSDKEVKLLIGKERLEAASADFADYFTEEDDVDYGPKKEKPIEDCPLPGLEQPYNEDWLAEMDADKKTYLCTIKNVVLILENDPALRNSIAYDEFEHRECFMRNLPWRKVDKRTKYITDKDISQLRFWVEKIYKFKAASVIEDAVNVICQRRSFHPIKEYFARTTWDGVKRVESLLIDYLGAADTRYTRMVTRKQFAGAVGRVLHPGIKFDTTLVLVGAQGKGKSTLLYKLGRQWFSDSISTVSGKDSFEQLQGVWIAEIAELSGFKKSDNETVKHYLDKRIDRFRVAYGRRSENFPRQVIFFGSTNKKDFLTDPTGNRRYWSVEVAVQKPTKNIFNDLTEEEIAQFWAEAVQIFKNGEPFHLTEEEKEIAEKVQQEFTEVDERSGLVQNYLEMMLPEDWNTREIFTRRNWLMAQQAGEEIGLPGVNYRTQVCVAEVWCECLGELQSKMTTTNTKNLHNIIKNTPGWEPGGRARCGQYGVQTVYINKANIALQQNKISSKQSVKL